MFAWFFRLSPRRIVQFITGCIFFNFLGFIGVVIVSFGSLSSRWLEDQQKMLRKYVDWRQHLGKNADVLVMLLKEWDTDGNGLISKSEVGSRK